MKITSPRRGQRASRRLDLSDLRRAVADRRVHTELAVVRKPADAAAHFEIVDGGEDVLVEVETVPGGQELTCRLGAGAGGREMGLWRIPAVGDEVAVLVPTGEIAFSPMIVAVLSSGKVPARLAPNKTVLVAPDELELIVGSKVIRIKDGAIQLGDAAAQQVVRGTEFRSKQASLNSTLQAQFNALATASTGPLSPLAAGFSAIAAAIAQFEAAAAGYLSSVTKTE